MSEGGAMRVVVDANVLVAAVRSRRGASFALLSAIPSARFVPCLSVALYAQWHDVLTRPENIPPGRSPEDVGAFCATSPYGHTSRRSTSAERRVNQNVMKLHGVDRLTAGLTAVAAAAHDSMMTFRQFLLARRRLDPAGNDVVARGTGEALGRQELPDAFGQMENRQALFYNSGRK